MLPRHEYFSYMLHKLIITSAIPITEINSGEIMLPVLLIIHPRSIFSNKNRKISHREIIVGLKS